MEKLQAFLNKYKFLNLLMFGFTLFGTLMGIVLGWKQFYSDYLAVEISMPVWVVILVVVVFVVVVVALALRDKSLPDPERVEIVGQEFGVQRLDVNGKYFKRCKFHGTEILLNVDRGFGLEHCEFINPQFTWGEQGSKVIQAMTHMYKEPALQPLIARSLENIVNDKTPTIINPNPM